MPFAPKRPCTYPGCRVLTKTGRCERHKYPTDLRPDAVERGYGYDWTKCRNAYIRLNPVCEIRKRCRGDAAVEVDHIVPIAHGGERLDHDNLQSTCKACHAWKTRNVDYSEPSVL